MCIVLAYTWSDSFSVRALLVVTYSSQVRSTFDQLMTCIHEKNSETRSARRIADVPEVSSVEPPEVILK